MTARPKMIPKMDRKLSSTTSDPHSRLQMIPRGKSKWPGLTFVSRLLSQQKVLINLAKFSKKMPRLKNNKTKTVNKT